MSWLRGLKVYVPNSKEDSKGGAKIETEHIYGMGTHCAMSPKLTDELKSEGIPIYAVSGVGREKMINSRIEQ